MSEALRHYGTELPPAAHERVTVGDVSFTLEDGALRHICVGKSEVIRGIAFLVRDRDWGTLQPELTVLSREETGGTTMTLRLGATYLSDGARLEATTTLEVAPGRLTWQATAMASEAFETNRTGFTVLHPARLAGCPVTVDHGDGSSEPSAFPDLIEPWQPFMDIAALTHHADGLSVRCAFDGDIFEMEDQRQWGDASFKTYNRPLAWPWPFTIAAADSVTQSVTLTWSRSTAAKPALGPVVPAATALFPETAILVTAADALRLAAQPEDIADVAPQRLLCHVDTSADAIDPQLAAFARLRPLLPACLHDLELVCGFADPPDVELTAVREALDRLGFVPDSVLVCPAVDRQSTPPGSDWPDCPPLDEIHEASALAFADIPRGGGMVSFFPELNRKRPPIERLDFVSHGLCPIVHAADDLSVMETLEAIPHITRTARSFIGDRAYRVGPSTIAMRHNPYGDRTIPNPRNGRVCMTEDDPRHRAAFGAAYTVGVACALATGGVAVWTPAELYGPRGLVGPMRKVVATLARCAGEPVHTASIRDGLAELRVGHRRIVANLSSQSMPGVAPYAVHGLT